ncbi:TRAP transporter fused permease subunit [Aliivibrio fischeri]|uniref:Transporter n=2 Tax=Aliivibrio fischeri TaxID=668 RepID=Q5E5W1_ALIF1|nr:TRAP transporter fused permease subunit [Aliivibrio fischeri]AAW85585.1 transporter [Aliivibrio fischeri ES114]KLU80139.1 transporter [Aliivibrio fischeri]MCE4934225.1 TRAP transporter fused permease subunit [Aliivibrio fischeri]MCE7564793.1 TRAP transporter fused permease subunit [Aliivibrio fischeri]MUK60838.1 TRAP transporter fused permease subunit [Aliivibrio fischeri]
MDIITDKNQSDVDEYLPHERTVTVFGFLILSIAVALSAFQIWQGISSTISATYFRPIHLCWVLILIFLHYPLINNRKSSLYLAGRVIDLILCGLIVFAAYRMTIFDYNDINHLFYGLQLPDMVAGCSLIILLMEGCRRTVGWVMVLIAVLFLSYSAFGDMLPAGFAIKSYTLQELIQFQIFSANGIFGSALGIAATTVFVFVLFGAFLEVTGAGKFFIDLAFSIAGKYRGGPAKAAVLASAGLGSISGSAIANTVTTGSITIPMMKKLGYKPEQAAGIEAAASTGGQIMPPIMGAGAFVMAQFTGVPYSEIMLASIAPAILYFFCTLLYVHLMACKLNLKAANRTEAVMSVMKEGAHHLIPLALITTLLMMAYSPLLVGVAGCAAILVTAALRKHSRIGLQKFIEGMKNGALMALPISAACGAAGIIVGVVGQTGIGLQFTQFVMDFSGGYLLIALGLISIVALVLGMGLPVTAAYIVLAVMAVPMLSDFGLSLLTAHLIVFWLSQTSNVTPPIALAAFAGAGVANANPMKSSVEAFKLAGGLFIIPIMMAYTNLVDSSAGAWSLTLSIVQTLTIIIAIAVSIEGYLLRVLTTAERLLAFSTIPLILLNPFGAGFVGIIIIAGLILTQWRGKPQVT